ncbi:MAG TPA: hypothetical protein VFB41_05975 [Solirubrobacteraceae bacterium]|nr:hypothetical protein [Solirubrobacteraceae bacterium]
MVAARNALARLARAWRSLAPEQRPAALAAAGLLVSMFLPWYEKSVCAVVDKKVNCASDAISAFGVASFIEAAIFIVAVGVLVLLFFRAERRAFHLPGGDGTIVLAAGLWAAFLLFVRVFSRPSVPGDGSTVGIQWGFFLAFLAAGGLAYAGWRMRIVARAEPTQAQDPTTRVDPVAALAPTTVTPRRPRATARRPAAGRSSGEDRTRIAGQLSFEEDDAPPPPSWEERPDWDDAPPRGS